jgi:GNAT superfamily N-acetyltransferase
MIIRMAETSDIEAIAKVNLETWRTTYVGIMPDDFLTTLTHENCTQALHKFFGDPANSKFMYVAENNQGQLVGFAAGGPERRGDPVYEGELYAIYILKPYQQQGIGRKLVAAVVDEFIDRNISTMLIWVIAENSSRAFYKALGGDQVRRQSAMFGSATLVEVGYGWDDLYLLREQLRENDGYRHDSRRKFHAGI